MATRVIHSEDGDTGVLTWGVTGKSHSYRVGDDEGFLAAYKSAVAEGLSEGDTFEDEVERSIARELQEGIGITFGPRAELGGLTFDWENPFFDPRDTRKDAADSTIIGWFPGPDLAEQLANIVGGGYSASAAVGNTGYPLHLTLAFLSDPDVDGTKIDLQLVAAITKIFTRWVGPLEGCISGVGRFVGPEDTDVLVALVDIPGLGDLRHCLRDRLLCESAVGYDSPLLSEQHGFVPHITLAWIPKSQGSPAPLTETIPVKIDSLTVAYGPDPDNAITFTLGYGLGEGDSAQPGRAEPYYAARDPLALAKAGRVLSAKNLTALQEAHEAMGKVIETATSRMAAEDTGDDPLGDAQATATKRREFLQAASGGAVLEHEMEYLITKAAAEDRYTLGPLYAPLRQDAHGEYTKPDVLQKAMWDFVQEKFDAGDNRLNLQHGDLGEIQVANMVEVVTWPYDHTITVTKADGTTTDLDMPAGTVYLGAIWDDDAWPLVKSGKLNGWSLGGKAVRVSDSQGAADMPHMGYKLAARGDDLDKMAAHSYVQQDAGGGVCKVCHMARGDGNHTTEKSASDYDRDEELALLAAAHEQDLNLARAQTETATLKAEGARASTMFGQVMDMLKGKREPDLHVHLPEQNVTINESGDPLAGLLAGQEG